MITGTTQRWTGPLLIASLLVLGTGCGGADDGSAAPQPTATSDAPSPAATSSVEVTATMTIADVLRTNDSFSRFRDLARRTPTGIAPTWLDLWDFDASMMGDNRDGVTVFVPTDIAFEALDPAILAFIESPDIDDDLLYALLGHHYVHRLYPSSEFEAGPQDTWRRSLSDPVVLRLDPLTWGGYDIEQTDLRVANGYIHAIAGVVIPDELAAAAEGDA